TVRVWRAEPQGAVRLGGHGARVAVLTFSPSGKHMASAAMNNTVTLWDMAGRKEVRSLAGRCAAFSADGQRLAVGGDNGVIKVFNAATGKELLSLPGHKQTVRGVAFSADRRFLASAAADQTEEGESGTGNGELFVWDLATGKKLHTLAGHRGPVSS